MLKAIGEQYPTERLGLSKTCSNQTLTDFTTFRISPPESCGAEAFSGGKLNSKCGRGFHHFLILTLYLNYSLMILIATFRGLSRRQTMIKV